MGGSSSSQQHAEATPGRHGPSEEALDSLEELRKNSPLQQSSPLKPQEGNIAITALEERKLLQERLSKLQESLDTMAPVAVEEELHIEYDELMQRHHPEDHHPQDKQPDQPSEILNIWNQPSDAGVPQASSSQRLLSAAPENAGTKATKSKPQSPPQPQPTPQVRDPTKSPKQAQAAPRTLRWLLTDRRWRVLAALLPVVLCMIVGHLGLRHGVLQKLSDQMGALTQLVPGLERGQQLENTAELIVDVGAPRSQSGMQNRKQRSSTEAKKKKETEKVKQKVKGKEAEKEQEKVEQKAKEKTKAKARENTELPKEPLASLYKSTLDWQKSVQNIHDLQKVAIAHVIQEVQEDGVQKLLEKGGKKKETKIHEKENKKISMTDLKKDARDLSTKFSAQDRNSNEKNMKSPAQRDTDINGKRPTNKKNDAGASGTTKDTEKNSAKTCPELQKEDHKSPQSSTNKMDEASNIVSQGNIVSKRGYYLKSGTTGTRDVNVYLPIAHSVKSKDVNVKIASKHLQIIIMDKIVLVDGALLHAVIAEDSFWEIGSDHGRRCIRVTLAKQNWANRFDKLLVAPDPAGTCSAPTSLEE